MHTDKLSMLICVHLWLCLSFNHTFARSLIVEVC